MPDHMPSVKSQTRLPAEPLVQHATDYLWYRPCTARPAAVLPGAFPPSIPSLLPHHHVAGDTGCMAAPGEARKVGVP